MDPGALGSLLLLTFLLGARHGLDPDHLAMVDNLARHNAEAAPRVARWCGAWFSLGHGCVVTVFATALAFTAARGALPAWLEGAGSLVSIVFLLVIGLVNLGRVIKPDAPVPFAPRSRLFAGALKATHPLSISLVGAFFAVSMDTLSQAALFSIAATGNLAVATAALLGVTFTLGMLCADLGSSYLALAAMRNGSTAYARGITFAVGILSLVVAACGALRLGWPRFAEGYEEAAFAFGTSLLVLGALAAVWPLIFRAKASAAQGR